jgi:hypothetical protein
MRVACPHCRSKNVRESLSYSFGEHIGKWLGFLKLRCRDCDERFTQQIWDLRNLVYARCPRCYRLDLSRWDLSHYHVGAFSRLRLKIGARPHRCEACRCNFVGFRPAKLKYKRPEPQSAPLPSFAGGVTTTTTRPRL